MSLRQQGPWLACLLSTPLSFLFFIFGCVGSLLLSSSCGEQGLLPSCSRRTSHCGGFSCGTWDLGTLASAVVVHGLSCPSACGILLDLVSNLCSLHWQVDSYPLTTREAPHSHFDVGPWVLHHSCSHPFSELDKTHLWEDSPDLTILYFMCWWLSW